MCEPVNGTGDSRYVNGCHHAAITYAGEPMRYYRRGITPTLYDMCLCFKGYAGIGTRHPERPDEVSPLSYVLG